MRFLWLVIFSTVISLGSACAANRPLVVLDNLQYRISGTYEFVSVDLLSACGRDLTSKGEARFEDGKVYFYVQDEAFGPVESQGYFQVNDNHIFLSVFDTPLSGTFFARGSADGVYLVITLYPTPNEMLDVLENPYLYSDEYREQAQNGIKWVFKKNYLSN